ncbi:retrovirus-related pol polyprotein from transposon TNT 1-94 [Tanacetum coccineum]
MSSDAPSFDSLFVIGKLNEQIQSRGNTIHELKEKISCLTKKNSDVDPIFDLKAFPQNKNLTAKLNALHDLNECFGAENTKVKQHYKELYDSIKITRAKTTNQNNSLLSEIENLKAQLKDNSKCVTIPDSKPKVLAPAQVEHQKINSTNAPGILSTRVKGASAASMSKPRSNTKKDRTLPAKSALKQVEAHSRMNKSNEKQKNHVVLAISVLDVWEPSSATKVWRVKQVKQVWKAIGKLFTTIGHQWRPTGRLLPLGDQWSLTRNTPLKVSPTKQWKPTGRLLPLGRQCPLVLDLLLLKSVMYQLIHRKLLPLSYKSFSDLEVAFRKHTCFVRDLDGVDLIKGNYGTNLYTIFVEDMMRSSPICLLSRASKNKSWLWHRRLNHLNFGTLNDLARKDLVRGLPRLKFEKDHLCITACQLERAGQATHNPEEINTIMEVLHTLHMDLCGPLRVQSINGKKYILVIVDDYSRFTWVKFLRTKDETPAFVINLLKQLQVGLNKTVKFVRTDNGTEFVNKALTDYYESVGITHEKTVPRTPQQNGIVERRNRTLVEALDKADILQAPYFLWAKTVATAYYTQNRPLIQNHNNKTPYELVHDKKPDLSFLHIFGALCYPTNDNEDLGKLKAKADIGFFVGYAPNRKGYRIYNKRTRQIMETIHVTFDELTEQTAPVHSSPGPAPNLLTPGPISSGLVPNPPPAAPYVPPTNKELEILFQPMFDEYFESSTVDRLVPPAPAAQAPVNPTGPSVSIPIDQEAPSGINPFAAADPEPFVNVFAPDHNSEASSSRVIARTESNQTTQPHEHLRKWTTSHPIDNIIRNPSRPTVTTRNILLQNYFGAFYNSVMYPSNCAMIIALKWIYKVKLDEYGDVLKNKARL